MGSKELERTERLSLSLFIYPKDAIINNCYCIRLLSEKTMATHSSTLAWKLLWMEEPGGLQSMGLRRVRHDWATSLSLFTFMHWRRKCNPLQCSCLENPRDGGTWWAAVYGVAQSRTWLKRLSSSSSSSKITVKIGWNKSLALYLAGKKDSININVYNGLDIISVK